jgi:hypothetical protein
MLKVAENFYQLSDDPSAWIAEISHIFSEKFPELAEFGVEVKLSKVNPEIGFALGSITVFSDVNEVHIPIIIREKKLAPLDIFEYKKVYYPLKASKVMNILYAGKLGTPVTAVPTERAVYPVMIGEIMPPPFGLGPRAEYYTEVRALPKVASSLFSSISNTVFSEDVKKTYDKFMKIAQSLSLIDTVKSILDKLLSLQSGLISAKSYLKNEIRRVRRNAFLIKKIGPDQYQIIFNPINTISMSSVVVNSDGLIKLLTALKYDVPAAFTDLDTGKVIYFTPEMQQLVPIVLEKIDAQPVTSPGRYVFVTANGKIIRGLVIKNLFGGWMLWSDPYAISDSLYGVKESDYVEKTPFVDECSPGQTILLRIIACNNSIGLGPIKVFRVISKRASCEVKPVMKLENAEFPKLVGKILTITGKYGDFPIKIEINPFKKNGDKIINLQKSAIGEIEVTICGAPIDILPVTYEVTLPTNEQEFYDYLALFKRPVNVEYLGDETYMIVSNGEKYKIDNTEKFILSLISMMIPKDIATKIASAAKSTKKLTLLGPSLMNKQQISFEKIAVTGQRIKDILGVNDDLIKSAILTGEGLTIDTVFALNLITPQNIQKFIESVPLIREVVNYLAKLLIFTRLGFKEFSEEDLSYLMKKLDEIADKLESLKIIYKLKSTA